MVGLCKGIDHFFIMFNIISDLIDVAIKNC